MKIKLTTRFVFITLLIVIVVGGVLNRLLSEYSYFLEALWFVVKVWLAWGVGFLFGCQILSSDDDGRLWSNDKAPTITLWKLSKKRQHVNLLKSRLKELKKALEQATEEDDHVMMNHLCSSIINTRDQLHTLTGKNHE